MAKLFSDSYTWTQRRKILTREQMGIAGLDMFGHDTEKANKSPLGEHFHTGVEFVYMVSGSQTYFMNGQIYTVTGNQLFIAPPHQVHGTGGVMHGRYEHYWFRLEMSTEEGFLMLDRETGTMLKKCLMELPSPVISPVRNLKGLMEQSFDLLCREDPLLRTEGCALLVQFLCEILRTQTGGDGVSKEISAALQQIHTHVEEDISLEELAAISGLSLSRFKSRFRQEVRSTPREYINVKKIQRAKILLTETEKSVTEIAFLLSFSSSSYFSALFRKLVGSSPSDYRQRRNGGAEHQEPAG